MPARGKLRKADVTPAESAVQLKITLRHIKPPIWRRLLLPDNYTLGDLHDAIQTAMGWGNCHLHAFRIGGVQYTDTAQDGVEELEMENEEAVLLRDIRWRPKQKIGYEYDFGDSWEHEVVFEKMLPLEPGTRYPVCVKGARACPPEDCGSVPGYYGILEALSDRRNPEHAELLDWVGRAYDPERFDFDEVNRRLASGQ